MPGSEELRDIEQRRVAVSMTDQVTLANGAVTTSRLGFGCGGLMRIASRRERDRLLTLAFESGVRHFDVARMYGLGAAERELGRFARTRRDEITIATKFGIETTSPVARLARLQPPVRAALKRLPAARRVIKRRGDAINAARRYDARAARRSLERSLLEAGTDYFDILFVHDPCPGDIVVVDELDRFFRQARDEGKIRAWGVAGAGVTAVQLAKRFGADATLQQRYALFDRSSCDTNRRGRIVFGFLAVTLSRLTNYLGADPQLRSEWTSSLGLGSRWTEEIAELLLLEAIDSNEGAVVLVSTTRPERMQRAAEAIDGAVDGERLAILRELAGRMPAEMVG
jgi:D-threo-aldose 1-dehydrogenase